MDVWGTNGMVSPSTTSTANINRSDVGGRRSQPRVTMYALRCDVMTGRRASTFCKRVATSLRSPVSPELSCGAVFCRIFWLMFLPDHWWNQFVVHDYNRSESGASSNFGDLSATA